MNPSLAAILAILGMFLTMLLLLELGRRFGLRRRAKDPVAEPGSGAIDAAVFSLVGLLIAFTFSGAASRFDARRQLVVEETNDIGTAWLRLDLLPSNTQPPLRDLFRRYTDARIAVYAKLPDLEAAHAELARSITLQNEIWSTSIAACRDAPSPSTTMLLLPALNQMFDITTTRTMAARMHPPALIYIMLVLLMLAGSLLAGFGMSAGKKRDWFHIVAFAAVMCLAIYVILDFEFPHFGLIQIHTTEQVLVQLRQTMNP